MNFAFVFLIFFCGVQVDHLIAQVDLIVINRGHGWDCHEKEIGEAKKLYRKLHADFDDDAIEAMFNDIIGSIKNDSTWQDNLALMLQDGTTLIACIFYQYNWTESTVRMRVLGYDQTIKPQKIEQAIRYLLGYFKWNKAMQSVYCCRTAMAALYWQRLIEPLGFVVTKSTSSSNQQEMYEWYSLNLTPDNCIGWVNGWRILNA